MKTDLPRLVFVVGPTACGKSDFAVEAAEEAVRAFGGAMPEIINCDSIQFFEGVEIGAAKPEPELLARAPHHLVGHVPLGGAYTAGDFRRDALRVIENRQAESGLRRFMPVGGSGFYVQALEKGMYDVPSISEEVKARLQSEIEEKGSVVLHAELAARDSEAAARIQPMDKYRVLRALEILRSSPEATSLSAIRAQFEAARPPAPFSVSKIGVFRPREALRRRVEERTRKMLRMGLLEEVEGLRAKGFAAWGPLQSVGYKEAQEYLDGRIAKSELEPAIVTSTMQLAKRQMTWFKRDASIRWFDSEHGWRDALAHVREAFQT